MALGAGRIEGRSPQPFVVVALALVAAYQAKKARERFWEGWFPEPINS